MGLEELLAIACDNNKCWELATPSDDYKEAVENAEAEGFKRIRKGNDAWHDEWLCPKCLKAREEEKENQNV